MKALLNALGVLIKILLAALVALIAVGAAFVGVVSWSQANAQQAAYECVVRRMDHHIAAESTSSYHDTCMAASGYRLSGCISYSNLEVNGPYCYAPRWQFWR